MSELMQPGVETERPDPSERSVSLPLTRRTFLKTASAAALAVTEGLPSNAAERKYTHADLIDCNVSISRWPFRRLPLDDTANLVTKLKSERVNKAWAGTFDALLHKDIGSANLRLVEECRKHGQGVLVPFGTVNPRLPDWPEELRRCHEQYKMPGLRLFPNYHGYKLDDAFFSNLLDQAEKRGLLVQIALSMEDERMQHPLLRVPNVDATSLRKLVDRHPRLKLALLNWFRAVNGDLLKYVGESRRVWFDIAMVEGVGGVSGLLQQVPADRILFGSHAPFYYFESALLKLKESALTPDQTRLIRTSNAGTLLGES